MSSQDEASVSVSDVDGFCANENCREPIVISDDDGYRCHECGEVFCQRCIVYLAEELHLEELLDEEEDGFCSDCAESKREELDPKTTEGKLAIARNAALKAKRKL